MAHKGEKKSPALQCFSKALLISEEKLIAEHEGE